MSVDNGNTRINPDDIDMEALRENTRETVDMIMAAAGCGHLISLLGVNKVTGEPVVVMCIVKPDAGQLLAAALSMGSGTFTDIEDVSEMVVPIAELLMEIPMKDGGGGE